MFEKAAEELDKMAEKAYAKDIQYIGMSANITYKLGFKAGYNKANEWHYVKNGLPTNTGLYLIFYYNSFFNDKVRCIARYSPDRKEFLNIDIRDGDEVIAWQELPVPPKESE